MTPMTPQHDKQKDLIDFVSDSETIKKAVEGSMDKRLKVLERHDIEDLRENIVEVINKRVAIAQGLPELPKGSGLLSPSLDTQRDAGLIMSLITDYCQKRETETT